MAILESSIAVLFILFVLSQISERLTNLLKLWLHNNVGLGNMRVRAEGVKDEEAEKLREKKITTMALLVGIFLALLIKADLSEILQIAITTPAKIDTSNATTVTKLFSGWSTDNFSVRAVIGCILTGVFLSFGSKWWHDLLDLLLELKNIRRKIAEGMK